MGHKGDLLKMVCSDAIQKLKKKDIRLMSGSRVTKKNSKYDKRKSLTIFHGYDLLENMLVVRHFVQRHYGITLMLLEILLYLAPKQYFSQQDLFEMPRDFRFNRIDFLLKEKHIAIASKGKNRGEHVYTLSTKSRNIVVKFYKLLSGEEKIPETPRENPMAKNHGTAIDKIRMELVKKVNALQVSETKKALY